MSSMTPVRKRDRLYDFLKKSAKGPSGTNEALHPSVPAPTILTPRQTNDTSQRFLADALKELSTSEQDVIREHVASNISDTVQAAYDAAKKQKTICEDKRWPVSDTADKVLLWLDRFKSVGDIIANVDPICVGLPWAGIRMLLTVAITDSHQMTCLVGGMNLALCMSSRLRAYYAYFERLRPALTTGNLHKALVALYAHILRFLVEAIRTYSRNTAVRKIEALWRESDLMAFEVKCRELGGQADIEANNCDRELRAEQWTVAAAWKDDLDMTLRKLDSIQLIQKSLDALQVKVDLSKLHRVQDATYNSSAEEKLSRCLDGTRSEILHNISQWVQKPDGKRMFWLCGKAGTGKSTISRTVAQQLEEQQCLGASFFFKRGEKDRSNADHFFSTIAAQLADVLPHMQAPIAAALDKDSFLCGRGLQEQFEKLLLQPLLTIDPAHLPRQSVAIVIDALDECDQKDIRMFLKLLGDVEAKSALRLRVFITSRPELPIQLGFRQLDGSLHQDIVLEEVQQHTIERDIRAYFHSEFAKIRADQLDNVLTEDWPSKADLQTLVDLAVPLFIFASTVCRFVSESKPKKRLKLILEQPYAAGASHLAKTYSPILNQLLLGKEKTEREEILEDFRRIIGPIILAADPLSVASLASLLRIEQNNINEEINDILRHLHSVLQIPPKMDDPVRLLHLSFRDFLIDQKREDKDGFWIDEVKTHKSLAGFCLQRLNERGTLKSDICSVERPGTRRVEQTTQQIATNILPDVAYACSYWPWHIINSREQLCDNSQVYHFLQQHFLHWLEALSWLGRLSSAVAYIGELLSMAQGYNSSKLAAFLGDAKRFLLKNRHVVDLAPLQVYHSAMIFAPMQSNVRRTFREQVPKLWARLPDMPLCWNAEILKLEGHDHWVTAVAFSPDGQVVASASRDKTVRLWNAQTGEQTQKLEGHDSPVLAVAFSPDGQVVASGSHDRTVRLWNVQTGEQTQTQKLEEHNSPVLVVAFSPDGQVVASASDDRTVRLWNVQTGEQTQKLEGHDKWVTATAFSPDGQVVALGSHDGTVRLWNVQTGEPTKTQKLEGHDKWVTATAFSLDGQVVASGSHDRTVRLWNVQTGEQTQKLEGHDGPVLAVAFSPDGQVVASGSRDRTVRLWNAQTGEQTQKLEGHDGPVYAVAFSPDGQVVASGSRDKTVRLWNAQTGEQTQTQKLEGHDSPVLAIAFSLDGKSLKTNFGTFVLKEGPLGLAESLSPRTSSLELNKEWLRYEGEDLLWLPHEYRGHCSALQGQTLVIGHLSGAVTFFELK